MKIIKKILYLFLVIIALALIAALFFPKSYSVSVTKTYEQPQAKLYDYVRMLETQKQYSEWLKPDPNASITLTGVDGTKGAKIAWLGDSNVGEGSQEIMAIDSNKIDVELRFVKPMASVAKVTYNFKKLSPTSTEMTMDFKGDSPYPMNLMSHLVGVPMIEKTTKQNFENIAQILK